MMERMMLTEEWNRWINACWNHQRTSCTIVPRNARHGLGRNHRCSPLHQVTAGTLAPSRTNSSCKLSVNGYLAF